MPIHTIIMYVVTPLLFFGTIARMVRASRYNSAWTNVVFFYLLACVALAGILRFGSHIVIADIAPALPAFCFAVYAVLSLIMIVIAGTDK